MTYMPDSEILDSPNYRHMASPPTHVPKTPYTDTCQLGSRCAGITNPQHAAKPKCEGALSICHYVLDFLC